MAEVRQHYPAVPETLSFPDTKLYWLETAPTVISSAALQAWLTVDVSDHVPHPSSSVLLEVEYAKSSSLGVSRVDFRKRANTQTIGGLSANPSNRGIFQIVVPVLSSALRRSFDYQLITTAIGTTFTVKVLGYYL